MNIRMARKSKTAFSTGAMLLGVLLTVGLLGACASGPKPLDPTVKQSQLMVNPPAVSLGVASLIAHKVEFAGCNFSPGDSVIITLMNVKKDGEVINIPIADGQVDEKGTFNTELSKLAKITDFLRANTELNDEMEPVLVIHQPTIPPGEYTVQAVCMQSNVSAESSIKLKKPGVGDKFNDWVGRVFLKKIKKI